MRCLALSLAVVLGSQLSAQDRLPGTDPLEEMDGAARSEWLVSHIDRFAEKLLQQAPAARARWWPRDTSSPTAYKKSVAGNRERLGRGLGLHPDDKPSSGVVLEYISSTVHNLRLAETASYVAHAVRWPAMEGLTGEGIYLKQREQPAACVVLLPDAGQTPEQLAGLVAGQEVLGQAAHELALAGCDVVIPTLVSRDSRFSGNKELGIQTNQSHREWIHRQVYEMGRTVSGYELRKVFALVEWMEGRKLPVAVVGFGEGGRLALLAAALDTRIEAALVSGGFDDPAETWWQPLDRQTFGLVREFGAAELASLVMPRALVVTHGIWPGLVPESDLPTGVRRNAAPSRLEAPDVETVRREVRRVRSLVGDKLAARLRLVVAEEGDETLFPTESLGWLRKELRLGALAAPSALRVRRGSLPDGDARQQRQIREMEELGRKALRLAERERNTRFWKALAGTKPGAEMTRRKDDLRRELWEEVIGRLPDPDAPPSVRSRVLADRGDFVIHEVVMDVWKDVPAWGWLLVPKGADSGGRRPLVVCQHGLEGLPEDVVNEDPASRAYAAYKGFGATLARQGYVVFAPHHFYRGKDRFRVIQRKLNLNGLTLFSVMIGQHQRLLDWLGALPWVDKSRIAFYGLSYGGKSAMRIPAVLPQYCLSICSGDFNEWVRKCASPDLPMSYVFTGEYEIWEWNLGNTFNYAEMAGLIAPRPFMVERGHDDGVAADEWVAYEFAKVFRHYQKQGLGDRAVLEYFDGPHTIHGVGTFEFLKQHLNAEDLSK